MLALTPFGLVRGAAAAPAAASSAAVAVRCPPAPPHPRERLIARPQWLANTIVTEYYPAPESSFSGELVAAPGILGRHRIDWLYSSRGLPMEGEGIGRDGRPYHFAGPYSEPWVNAAGRVTTPCPDGSWTRGRPVWLAFGWRTAQGKVTFPLAQGGWSQGPPRQVVPPPRDLRFRPGHSLPLTYWHSVAVDPRLVPRGSRIFIPAYCDKPNRGWFVAEDTGGAIIGHHVDVYRPAPPLPLSDQGRLLTHQRVFVVPPRGSAPRLLPSCSGSARRRRRSASTSHHARAAVEGTVRRQIAGNSIVSDPPPAAAEA